MAESDSKPRRRLKYGCLGLLATAGALALGALALVGFVWVRQGSASPQTREFTHEATAVSDAPSPAERTELASAVAEGPGRVELDLELGLFTIQPGEFGEPLRLVAHYDTRAFDLEESFESDPNGGWVYRVGFKSSRGSHLGLLGAKVGFVRGTRSPTLRLILPRGTPLALHAYIATGHTAVELGGLSLTDVDLVFHHGGLRLSVDEPLARPVDSFSVRGKLGALIATSLGNASPSILTIDQRMGGLDVDLRGAWVRDADVRIVCRMGGGALRLPEGVAIEGLRPDLALRNVESEIRQPTVHMSVTSRLGELRIID